ncbi:GNAT family N-acetyltransferase [Paenibacillus aquistagni]|uniref:N-acetyltransferase domain-containing protein n=1 Tax=Paenibacillus aquistagni TaxID=1852522 RepID=A0A1X7LKP3_9BACL|nr:GNAT family N-acetyltransferase [Paenibacillus aquistagni]SMG54345.1 hypothetical protein SAMN06295960_3697 [Paenibacillus aquistagni]
MSVVRLKEDRYREALALSEYAFQYKYTSEAEMQKSIDVMKQHHQLFGVMDEDQIAAKLHLIPLEISFGDQIYSMGGIAGVATYPQYRRNGYVRAMLKHVLEKMREDGHVVSMLHPFSVPFYRKFGWELFTNRLICTLNKSDLMMQKQVLGKVKLYHKDTHTAEISTLYDQYAKRYSGMLVRSEDWWKRAVYDDLTAAVYYNEDGVAAGYMLYEIKDSKMTVEEFIPLQAEARYGLWNFICQHDSMVNELKMILHEQEPLLHTLKEPRIKAERKPYFMARIVDAECFLEQYSFNWEGQLGKVRIHITDEAAPWNNVTAVLDAGELRLLQQEERALQHAQLNIEIGALTAMLFGYKRPLELHELEGLSGPIDMVESLEELIPHYRPFFLDFF